MCSVWINRVARRQSAYHVFICLVCLMLFMFFVYLFGVCFVCLFFFTKPNTGMLKLIFNTFSFGLAYKESQLLKFLLCRQRFFIHMSNVWICVVSCVCPASWPTILSGRNLIEDIMCKAFNQFVSYQPCL